MLAFRTKPEVPVVQEEVHAVLFRRDRIVLRNLEHRHLAHRQLEPPRSPLVLANGPFELDGAFLCERARSLPRLFR